MNKPRVPGFTRNLPLRWIFKIAVAKVLSGIPGGRGLWSILRKNITGTPESTSERVLQKITVGMQYLHVLERFMTVQQLRQSVHIDIGSGWMPTIPLLFYSIGVQRHILCDVRCHMEVSNAAKTVQIFREIISSRQGVLGDKFTRLPPPVNQDEKLDEYFDRLGFTYVAPFREKDIIVNGAFKVITCTQVLLSLTCAELQSLLKMVVSSLSESGGMFIATVHLYDLYSDSDPKLSRYNKYSYSDFVWDHVINSKITRFNRLTASAYHRLLEQHGFELLEFDAATATEADLIELRRVPLHPRFYQIPEAELASPHLLFAAKLRGDNAIASVVS